MSIEDFEKLGDLYNQIYEVAIMIGQLIDRRQHNGLDNILDVKENLYKEAQAILLKLGEDVDLSRFVPVCEKIREQEAMNINMLTGISAELKKQIDAANKKSKIVNAYSNTELKQGNLLDFRQ